MHSQGRGQLSSSALTSGSARPDLAAHTTVSGSDRLGSNWNVDPRLTFATDTSGSSVAAVSNFGQFGGPSVDLWFSRTVLDLATAPPVAV